MQTITNNNMNLIQKPNNEVITLQNMSYVSDMIGLAKKMNDSTEDAINRALAKRDAEIKA